MRGHGCTVTGKTIRDAVRVAVYLMVNARLQTEAMRLGDVTFLSGGGNDRDSRNVGITTRHGSHLEILDAAQRLFSQHDILKKS